MSAVNPFARSPRGLARFLDTPTGLTAEEAITRADIHLETHRHDVISEIVTAIDSIAASIEQDEPDLKQVQALANGIFSVAGTFGFEGLGRAAISLCRVTDRAGPTDAFIREVLRIHLATLRALAPPHTHPADHEASLLEGVEKLAQRMAAMRQGAA